MGDNDWYVSDVTIEWDVASPIDVSSVSGCETTVLVTDTAETTYTCEATNDVGTTTESVTLKRDTTAPSITSALSPDRPSAGWWNIASGAPTATFTCSDETSGVATCSEPHTFSEGADQVTSGVVTDQAGNTATTDVSDIDVDLTAPIVTGQPIGAWQNDGWSISPVFIAWDVQDALSGPGRPCDPDDIFTEGANQSVTCDEATDVAGNPGTGAVTGLSLDMTAPEVSVTLSPELAENAWYNSTTGAPTASFSCSDATSGLAWACPEPFVVGEGFSLWVDAMVADRAGNFGYGFRYGFNVDLTAPMVDHTVTGESSNGWYTGDVTISWNVNDYLSGIAQNPCPDVVISAESETQTVTCTATDAAGNTTTETVEIPREPASPTITASVSPQTPDGSNGWYVTAPTVAYTCTSGSDVVSCGPDETLGESAAAQSSTGTVIDSLERTANTTVEGLKVDLNDPTNIAFAGDITDGASYEEGSVPAEPTCAAEDTASGIDSCEVTGYDTAAGPHTLTATATDNAGRSTTAALSYTVTAIQEEHMTFKGFSAPIAMDGAWNTVKGGGATPLKFEVFSGDTEVSDVAAISSVTMTPVACITGEPTGEATPITSKGGSSLRYDAAAGRFIQNWSAPKMPGSCYQVTVTTTDSSTLSALFKLK